ncbi:MAG: efflux RND transporter periplasmic adaptor subunit [Planctomycetes bacterium]|nr:efflux RND transporter periplasmic adaptor subunit [Planctomycetota bacterium]
MRRVALSRSWRLGLWGLALVACGGNEPGPGPASAARELPSAEAFCAEHGVAEAVCTKCNPKLVPIFQERGDWCAEHQFPESFCPLCHPERGGRPAVEQGADAPAHGMKVQLATPETARLAGIETVAARAESAASTLAVLGTIAYDATRQAEVNARVSGIVRAILVDVGQRVEAGAALVQIESAEVGAEQARLLTARARGALASEARARLESLLAQGMAAQKDVLAAQLELDTARAEEAAASAALAVVGINAAGIGNAGTDAAGPWAASGNLYTLAAPLAGTCVRRAATIGRLVAAGELLCEIVDTSVMWAVLDLPEDELEGVRPGLEAVITVDALGAREFRGQIDSIASEIDRHTRTVQARVRLANPDGLLRANAFVRARIELTGKQARVLVPRDALQVAKGSELVFVELVPGQYELRRVSSAPARGELVELTRGVAPGELVVTRGSFLLKTETLKGEIGAGCCAEE